MKVLDLFSGLDGWSKPWADRGHETFTIDLDERFDSHAHIDITDTAAVIEAVPWKPDVILASPPCNTFSLMSVGRYWNKDGTPKNQKAVDSLRLVESTRELIDFYKPSFWVIENPMARLRTLDVLSDVKPVTVTYCQYGEKWMKPTDLWGGFPPSLELHPKCKNGAPCHQRAPRGSKTGSRGVDKYRSAMIPYKLSEQICIAAEKDIVPLSSNG